MIEDSQATTEERRLMAGVSFLLWVLAVATAVVGFGAVAAAQEAQLVISPAPTPEPLKGSAAGLEMPACFAFGFALYRMAYDDPISTMLGKEQWSRNNLDIVVGVPKCLRPRGRPKKRRIPNFLEIQSTKTRAVHKCGRCGLWGHHKNTCKEPLSQTNSNQCDVEALNIEQPSGNSIRPKLPIRRDGVDGNPKNFIVFLDDEPLIRF